MGSLLSTFGSLLIGGVVAAATIFGVVTSQTAPQGPSPVNADQPVIEYGSTN